VGESLFYLRTRRVPVFSAEFYEHTFGVTIDSTVLEFVPHERLA